MQTITQRQIHFVPDGQALSAAAAEAFVDAVEKAIASRGVAAVALCGGSTSRKLFDMLTAEPYASRLQPLWTRLHVFWTTELHVQPDHPESCYRLAHWSLLSRFAIPSRNIHRIRGEMADGASVASAYHHELRTFFQPRGLMREGFPCFDLTILALEAREELESIETASDDARRWVTTRTTESRERGEIGLTLSVLRNARSSLLLFSKDAAAAGRATHLLRFVA
jgi:6-phosphogluconolactonase/glucosamine-6-phosphate isomerase/deaminase